MTAEAPDPAAPPDAEGDDATSRVMAAAGALIQAQTDANEAVLQQLFAELRALTTLIPGATPPPGDDDDRFDDVPV